MPSITYPGGAPSIDQSTGALTVSALLKAPTYLAKRVMPDTRQFLSQLLFRPATTASGAVVGIALVSTGFIGHLNVTIIAVEVMQMSVSGRVEPVAPQVRT